jgi:predicted small integral membrane protein
MPVIMIFYYMICVFLAGMLIWNFIREKQNKEDMLLYLIVLVPIVLRIFRIR